MVASHSIGQSRRSVYARSEQFTTLDRRDFYVSCERVGKDDTAASIDVVEALGHALVAVARKPPTAQARTGRRVRGKPLPNES